MLSEVSHLRKSGKSVVYCWIHGHSVLPGSEACQCSSESEALHETLVSGRILRSDVCTNLHVLIYPYAKMNGIMVREISCVW